MKMILSLLSLASLNAAALTIDQDKGRLEITYAKLNKPYDVQLTQPADCAGAATLETKDSEIIVRHASGCDSGAIVKVQVNVGQDVKASLGAGALVLADFAAIATSTGKINASAGVGSVRIPDGYDFKKISQWSFVGKSYSRDAQASGPSIDLNVTTGAVEIKR